LILLYPNTFVIISLLLVLKIHRQLAFTKLTSESSRWCGPTTIRNREPTSSRPFNQHRSRYIIDFPRVITQKLMHRHRVQVSWRVLRAQLLLCMIQIARAAACTRGYVSERGPLDRLCPGTFPCRRKAAWILSKELDLPSSPQVHQQFIQFTQNLVLQREALHWQ